MKMILLVTVALASLVAGCSSSASDNCSAKSKCSAQPAPTDAQIKQCKEAADSNPKCSSQVSAFGSCSIANEVCGADNKTDVTKTPDACKTPDAEVVKCHPENRPPQKHATARYCWSPQKTKTHTKPKPLPEKTQKPNTKTTATAGEGGRRGPSPTGPKKA